MSGDGISTGSSSVVFLVDSSVAVASQWQTVLKDYMSALLQRLAQHITTQSQPVPNAQFRMAWITYGTSETRPTPLLTKRFFAPAGELAGDMRQTHSRLGLGRTAGAIPGGMAVLEGLVAAIEMFDLMTEPVGNPVTDHADETAPTRPAYHIIHIAAHDPDNTPRPLYNSLNQLDSLSWTAIPEAIRKRKINWNLICLQNTPRLSEIHASAIAGNSSIPWFSTAPQHSISLAGFPSPEKFKRPLDMAPSVQPEAKRPRTAAPAAPAVAATTPKPPTPPSVHAPPPSMNVLAPSAPAPPPAKPQPTLKVASNTPVQVQNAHRQLQLKVNHLKMLTAAGRVQEADVMKKEIQILATKLMQYQQQVMARRNEVAQGQGAPAPTHEPPANQSTEMGSLAPPVFGGAAPTGPADKNYSDQMRKLLEQQHNQRQSLAPPSISPIPGPPPERAPSTKQETDWVGMIAYSGNDSATNMRKEIQLEVRASMSQTQNVNFRPETWPQTLELVPSRQPSVQMIDFKAWVTRLHPIICVIKPDARTTDTFANLQKFNSLIELLRGKNIYALAAWNMPSGQKENMILISPFVQSSQSNLIACYFPNGIPEMPTAGAAAGAQNLRATQLQRQAMQQQLHHVQQVQNAGASQGALALPFGDLAGAAAHNLENPRPPYLGQPGFNVGRNPGLGVMPGMSTGGSMGNLSMEMLQSFAMRNADGGNTG